MKGFKNFIMQGNVVELAVAVVIAGAFGKVVEAFVNFIMAIISRIFGGPADFDKVTLFKLPIGPVITALVAFLILALAVYLIVVKPYEAIQARRKAEEAPAVDESVELLKEIRDSLKARG